MALTFQDTNGSTGSGTLTSSGTYLTTANFTGSGSFEAVVLPSITNTTDCGAYTNPVIELAVLVTSLDATVGVHVVLLLDVTAFYYQALWQFAASWASRLPLIDACCLPCEDRW